MMCESIIILRRPASQIEEVAKVMGNRDIMKNETMRV